jgi:hypothetical protein
VKDQDIVQELILGVIRDERFRQDVKVARGKLPFNCSNSVTHPLKLSVLVEEVGEVSTEVYNYAIAKDCAGQHKAKNRLEKELIQVAAVCVAWLEALANEKEAV